MYIIHIALGGCLTAPDVPYGLTEDTGGHIAYVLGAATAQAKRADVDRVDIVTRAFDDPRLGSVHARLRQRVGPKMDILRLATGSVGYLAKEALAAEIPALRRAFVDLLAGMDRRPDAIHAHFSDAAILARAAGARFGIPTLYTPHSLGIDKRTHLQGAADAVLAARIDDERAALAGADAVVVSSRDEAERQVEAYGIDVSGPGPQGTSRGSPCRAAPPNPRAAEDLLDPWFAQPDKPLILAIARPVRRKNLATLLRAYAADPRLQSCANLALVAGQHGSTETQNRETRAVVSELRDLVRDHGLAGRVALPDRHEPGSVPALYALAAARRGVFVNPAVHEPFGLTLLEAAHAGLPVVATREGGPVDIVGRIGHGTLVDPLDPRAIAGAIGELIGDAPAWNRASEAGRAGVARFDWARWAARTVAIGRRLKRPIPARTSPRRILACDMDGTLTGDREAVIRLGDRLSGRHARGLRFVVATGRCLTEARAVLADWDLPEPDAFVTAVGSEIHTWGPDGRLTLDRSWGDAQGETWNRAAVLRHLEESGIEMQPAIEQRRWKLACHGPASSAVALRRHLRRAGLQARVIASHGHLIDVLPPNGGKAAAIGHLAACWGLSLDACIAAGDSGNDADMLVQCGRGVLVGNALPELADLSGPAILRSHLPHADGVLDGIDRLGLLPRSERPSA